MSDSYRIEITNTLPLSEVQYDSLIKLLDGMGDGDAMLVKVSNHEVFDDFMAAYLEWRDYGYHMELDFPMDDFGWKYPLVLASGLGRKQTKQLLRELLVDVSGTGESEIVNTQFRQVTAKRYGEKKAEEYSKN